MLKKLIICIIIFSLIICNYVCCVEKVNIQSNSYICYERNSESVIFGENINTKVPMASTTKIMTAILTIEYGKMDEFAKASVKAQNTNGQQLKLNQGDEISLSDLLYAIMLYSANDGAVVLAEHIGGSVENFCLMMNEKAKEIGAINTNFTSPHGLDDANHYSTPYDLAIIMDYALNMQIFKDVIGTQYYSIKINDNVREIKNTNKLLSSMENIVGGKTGYTGNAEYCLVCNQKYKELDVISVILKSPSSKIRFMDTEKAFNYINNNYIIVDITDYIKDKISITVKKTLKKDICLKPIVRNNRICILKDNAKMLKVEYNILDNIQAPVKMNEIICNAEINIGDNNYMTIPYVLEKNVYKNSVKDYFIYVSKHLGNMLKIT